jgi:hypothetical protein
MKYALMSCLLIGMFLSSFYVFPSGMPQPADFFILCWAILTLLMTVSTTSGRLVFLKGRGAVVIVAVFVAWTVIVSITNALVSEEPSIIFPPVFYIYNLLVFVSILLMPALFPESYRRILFSAIIACGAGLMLSMALNFEFGVYRNVGGFNNPNQLGFFSLLLGCCVVLVFDVRHVGVVMLTLLSVCTVGVFGSASLSAMLGFILVLLAGIIKYRKILWSRNLAFVAIFGTLAASLNAEALVEQLQLQFERRLNVVDRKLENTADVRGYTRIIEFPQYLLLGAGEGGRARFGAGHSHEMHSTLGTVLFSYGIVGLGLFIAFILNCIRGAPFHVLVLLTAPFVYALTHMGLRTTMFWILLAMVALLAAPGRERLRYPGARSVVPAE